MKNILEILQNQGIQVPDDKKEALEKSVLENYKTVSDYENQSVKLEQAEKKAADQKQAFEEFKKGYEGVDVEEMKTKITNLEATLNAKEQEYEKENSLRSLQLTAKKKAEEFGCIDFDLVEPLLNKEELLQSKDQTADITSFLNGLKESKPVLFKEKDSDPTGETISIIAPTGGKDDAGYNSLRASMGLPPQKGE